MNKKFQIIIGALLGLVVVAIAAVALMIVNLLKGSTNDYVTKDPITICVGQSVTLSNQPGMNWSSSVPHIVNVESNGKITGLEEGTTVVTAINGKDKYEATVVVSNHDIMDETCTTPRICKRCNKVLSPALGHTYSDATCTEDSVCLRCNKLIDKAHGHSMTEVSCTESAHCTVCGYVETEAWGHDYCAVSCTQDSVCSRCGDIAQKALGHDVAGGSCTEDGICSRCNKVISAADGHKYTEATCEKPATCTKCGATKGEKLECKYEIMGSYYDPATDLVYADLRCKYCNKAYLPAQPYERPEVVTFEVYTDAKAEEALAKELLNDINEKRRSLGIAPLKLIEEKKVKEASDLRAREIIINYSGTRLDGSDWTTAYETNYKVMVEYIARGHRTGKSLADAWLQNDNARASMLNSAYTAAVITCIYAPNSYDKYYWEVLYITE